LDQRGGDAMDGQRRKTGDGKKITAAGISGFGNGVDGLDGF